MANITNLSQFLSDIADAIRTKKETTEQIPAENFDQEILSIETGIDTSDANAVSSNIEKDKTAYVNGEKIIGNLPVIDSYMAGIAGAEPTILNMQDVSGDNCLGFQATQGYKAILNQNATVGILAKNSKVANHIGLTPEKITKGNTILDIEGTAESSGPIKIYSSVEEMFADVEEPDGEYGVVYYSKIKEPTIGDTISKITCPAKVVLSEAITSSSSWHNDSFDLRISLSNTACSITYHGDSGSTRVNYSSNDGLTYTNSSGETVIEFSTDIVINSTASDWNDVYGKFMLAGGMYFEGMYEWVDEVDEEWYDSIININVDIENNIISSENEEVYLPYLKNTILKMVEDGIGNSKVVTYENGEYYATVVSDLGQGTCVRDNKLYYPAIYTDDGGAVSESYKVKRYKLDLQNINYEFISEQNVIHLYTFTSGSYTYDYYGTIFDLSNVNIIAFFNSRGSLTNYNLRSIFYLSSTTMSSVTKADITNFKYNQVSFKTWHHVKTEFTLETPAQLLPGFTALGKHGPVTGNETIYDNISINTIVDRHIDMETLPSDAYRIDTDNTPGSNLLYMNKRDDFLHYNLHRKIHTGIEDFVVSLGHTPIEFIVLHENNENVYYLCACDEKDSSTGGYRLLTIKYNKSSEFTLLYDSINPIIYTVANSNGVFSYTYDTHTLCISTNKTAAILDIDLVTGQITVLDDAIAEYASLNGTSLYVNNIQNGCVVDNVAYLLMHKRLVRYHFDTKKFDWEVSIINKSAGSSNSTYYTNWFEYNGKQAIVILSESSDWSILLSVFDSNTSVSIKTITSGVSNGYNYSTVAPSGGDLYLLKYDHVEKYDGSTLVDVTDDFTLDVNPNGSQQMVAYGFYYENVFYNINSGIVMDINNKHIYICQPGLGSSIYTKLTFDRLEFNNGIFTCYSGAYKHIIETNVSLDNVDTNSYGIVCRNKTKDHDTIYQIIYKKDYSSVTDKEYNTALDTSARILGNTTE